MRSLVPRLFHAVALIEALTWAGLLIGMTFKYLINGDQRAVRIFGALHGAAFIVYSILTVVAGARFRWGARVTAVGVLAAFPPFCTVLFDRWAKRTGRLAVAEDRDDPPNPAVAA